MTTAEAAVALGVSERTWQRYCRRLSIAAIGTTPGPAPQNLYAPAQVEQVRAVLRNRREAPPRAGEPPAAEDEGTAVGRVAPGAGALLLVLARADEERARAEARAAAAEEKLLQLATENGRLQAELAAARSRVPRRRRWQPR